GSSSSSSLLIRSKNPRRCQAENPLKLLSEFAGPALSSLFLFRVKNIMTSPGPLEGTGGLTSLAGTNSMLLRSPILLLSIEHLVLLELR
ncbi:hypothetical protein, partial [Bradyrhizobium liaoningense]|uniref:hypothetical protein n=1 Tax=Bradyrhizobium liaoningense TaxID=43992 RepID=UPI0024E06355